MNRARAYKIIILQQSSIYLGGGQKIKYSFGHFGNGKGGGVGGYDIQ